MSNLKIPFGLAGASVGMGLVGEAIGSTGLKQGGATAGAFIGSAVNIAAGGTVIGMLKSFPKSKSKSQKL